jgi:hypothetical protein
VEAPSHWSALHGLPSLEHVVPWPFTPSGGHAPLTPSQASALSHSPAAVRHRAPALPAGCAHAASDPVHTSRVHRLPSSAHAVFAGLKVSEGQAAEVPEHTSMRSHSPVAGRHGVFGSESESAGQALVAPSQRSTGSQVPADARQVVVFGSFASPGQASETPSQTSCESQTPAEALQRVFCGIGEQVPGLPGRLHAWQSAVFPPPHAVAQQTLSTQLPAAHSLAPPHAVPGVFLVVQTPPAQY